MHLEGSHMFCSCYKFLSPGLYKQMWQERKHHQQRCMSGCLKRLIAFLDLQAPGMKNVTEFFYAFKIRDKKNPKDWYLSEDLTLLPAEKDIGVSFLEKVRIRLTGK